MASEFADPDALSRTQQKRILTNCIEKLIELGRDDAESGSWDGDAIQAWPRDFNKRKRELRARLEKLLGLDRARS